MFPPRAPFLFARLSVARAVAYGRVNRPSALERRPHRRRRDRDGSRDDAAALSGRMPADRVPLLSIPSPSSSTLELGPLSIHFYGLTLLVAIAAAVAIAGIRWTQARRRLGSDLPRRRVGRRVRDRRRTPVPRRHELERAARRVVGALRDLEGRARRLGRDRARLHRRRDRGEALRRVRREARRLRRARRCSSRRASAASGTGGTRSSSASRPTSRGASRSTPPTGRSSTSTGRRSIRPSCTRPCGASPRRECCC